MQPFSYSGVKIIHDQQIEDALERQRLHAGQESHRYGPLQALGKFFARFADQPEQEKQDRRSTKLSSMLQ